MHLPTLNQQFQVEFSYPVHFTQDLFHPENRLLRDTLAGDGGNGPRRIFFVLDSGVAGHHPQLVGAITEYVNAHAEVMQLSGPITIIPGGERCKNDPDMVTMLLGAVNSHHLDRHSYFVGLGGGAVLDLVGYVASVAHRGLRHLRIPTTVLSQNDSGIGVKNSVNAFGKKNFLGNFAPPYAVFNDRSFLLTLEDRDWRGGIAEALKVALIKDEAFFGFIEANAPQLAARDMPTMQYLIHRSAELHLAHIAGDDPFEQGTSRPLDFGHWSAHKLEQLSHYRIRHGEAVAIGIALDSVYSHSQGLICAAGLARILAVIRALGFALYTPEMIRQLDDITLTQSLLHGLQEFREHLGGQLTIMLLEEIGRGKEVHTVDNQQMARAVRQLQQY